MIRNLCVILILFMFSIPPIQAASNNKSSHLKNPALIVGNIDSLDLERALIEISGKEYRLANKIVILNKQGELIGRKGLDVGLNVRYSTTKQITADNMSIMAIDKITVLSERKKGAGVH